MKVLVSKESDHALVERGNEVVKVTGRALRILRKFDTTTEPDMPDDDWEKFKALVKTLNVLDSGI